MGEAAKLVAKPEGRQAVKPAGRQAVKRAKVASQQVTAQAVLRQQAVTLK